jgi:hypothetical protein
VGECSRGLAGREKLHWVAAEADVVDQGKGLGRIHSGWLGVDCRL